MIPDIALNDFLAELRRRSDGEVRTDDYSKVLYSTDASLYQMMPHAVLLPKTADDIQAAIELAARHKIPITARTGGSSLAGQAVNEALIIDCSRHLDGILEFNEEERWVRVGPGVVLDELNEFLKLRGFLFGPDPASSNRAQMGGIVANNSTGSHSIMYGMTADHVLETRVILSDGTIADFGPVDSDILAARRNRPGLEGEIYRAMGDLVADPANRAIIEGGTPKHWRRCGGYNLDRLASGKFSFQWPADPRFNLSRLICGSEGTLGVMTEIKLNVVPLPKKTAIAVVHFDDLFKALQAIPTILEAGPSAAELMDHMGLTLCKEVPDYARLLHSFIDGDPDSIIITEFYGDSDLELRDKMGKLQAKLSAAGSGELGVVQVIDGEIQANVWKVRKVALGLLMSLKGDYKPVPFIEDAAVPVEHLAEYVTKIEKFCNNIGTQVAYYAHASAGCVHIRPLINAKKAREVSKLPEITAFSVGLLKGYGGSLSSEHGDGKARSWFNEQFFGPELYGLYQQTKAVFDPQNIMNPGHVVNAESMTENLRYGEKYDFVQLEPILDFSEEQGFDRAVEMCNGAGICRKKTTGAMCPSFMATREEEHSTRGRANALRSALSGKLPEGAFTSERMYEVMDLCIECKACKAECPSSVDMAKIKFEFLAQYHKANGTPLRTKFLGAVPRLTRMAAGPFAGLANTGGALAKGLLGFTKERPLPRIASKPFTKWFRKNGNNGTGGNGQVVLFHDTFNTYNTPEVAIAAVEVLEAAGFEVLLSNHGCCGRPAISKGLVDEAKSSADQTVQALVDFAKKGIPVVGLEPSCLLTLRDEYGYLASEKEDAARVAENAFLFEEFIAGLADEGKLDLRFSDATKRVILHGHCHQKSIVGTEPTKKVLGLPANYEVEELDTSCCGMAGSFGYEKEHYDISVKMAERRLLPAIRKEKRTTIVCAPGFSCRHQIDHGAGREALHPAQILRDALESSGPA